MFFVPVVDGKQKPLMPTTILRARRWIKSGKATPFWKRGVFCVRLNIEPTGSEKQEIACGIDPGSKMEGFTVKAATKDYLNIQAKAVTWVKDAVETRRNMRHTRRSRKTPCRKNRMTNEENMKLSILNLWVRNMLSDLCHNWRKQSLTMCSPFTYCAYDLEQVIAKVDKECKESDIAVLAEATSHDA